MNGETAAGVAVDLFPCLDDVGRVRHRHRGLVEKLSPFGEVIFHLAGTVAEVVAWPDSILLQIPAPLFCLYRPNRRDEAPLLFALHFTLSFSRRLVDESGTSRSAPDTILLVEF